MDEKRIEKLIQERSTSQISFFACLTLCRNKENEPNNQIEHRMSNNKIPYRDYHLLSMGLKLFKMRSYKTAAMHEMHFSKQTIFVFLEF